MVGLGLRNLLRNKVRSVLVVVLIAVPFFLLLAMGSIGEAVQRQTAVLLGNVNTVLQLRARGSMGHINMIGQDRLLPNDILGKVRRVEHVVHAEPYLLAMAPIAPPNFVMHVGLSPGAVKRLGSHGEAGNPRLIVGRDFIPEDTGQDVAIIGQGYAAWANVKPEDMGEATLTIDPTRTHPVIYALDRPKRALRIVGVYASGYVFGDLQLFMPIDIFRSIYGTDRGISWIFAQIDSAENVAGVFQRLNDVVGDVADIVAPKSAAIFTATTSRVVIRLSIAGAFFAFALMTLVIFFLLLMQVRERVREIGTLKAIGADNRAIAVQFVTEALAYSVLGGVLGLLFFRFLGPTITGTLFAIGIGPFLPSHYKPLFESLAVSSQISPLVLILILAVAAAAAVAGSAYGVWQIRKLSPLEALRHE